MCIAGRVHEKFPFLGEKLGNKAWATPLHVRNEGNGAPDIEADSATFNMQRLKNRA
jgi:hypothetical protein